MKTIPDFADEEAVASWLSDRTPNVAWALAARSALRVLPGIDLLHHEKLTNLTMSLFRAVLLTAVSVEYLPGHVKTRYARDSAAASAAIVKTINSVDARDNITDLRLTEVEINRIAFSALSAHAAVLSVSGTRSSICVETAEAIRQSQLCAKNFSKVHGEAGRVFGEHAEHRIIGCAELDAAKLESSQALDLFDVPLWHDEPKNDQSVFKDTEKSLKHFFSTSRNWIFWGEWYDGMRWGRPLDWMLQGAVAQIPSEFWQGDDAPSRIAGRIAIIEVGLELKKVSRETLEHLKNYFPGADSPMMGHNFPPSDEVLPFTPLQLGRLEQALSKLEAMPLSDSPNRDVLESAVKEVDEVRQTVGQWFAEKLDISSTEFFKELGKWSGRLAAVGMGSTALWVLDLFKLIQPLFERLQKLIQTVMG